MNPFFHFYNFDLWKWILLRLCGDVPGDDLLSNYVALFPFLDVRSIQFHFKLRVTVYHHEVCKYGEDNPYTASSLLSAIACDDVIVSSKLLWTAFSCLLIGSFVTQSLLTRSTTFPLYMTMVWPSSVRTSYGPRATLPVFSFP